MDLQAKAAGAAALAQAGTSYQQVGMADAMKEMASKSGSGGAKPGGGSPMDTGVNLGLAMMMPQMMAGMLQPGVGANPPGVHAVPQQPQQPDPFVKLRQLKELLDIGAITPAEFDAKKVELMARI
jgi:membrane protease subunit (stomatin/prohibitin family)